MKTQAMKFAWLTTVCCLSASIALSAGTGDPAPAFSLEDSEGKTHKLADYKGRFVVLEWTNYDCPFVKKHYGSGNMQALQESYTGKGVVWLSINSSAPGKQGNYDARRWRKLIKEHKAKPTALLLDPTGAVGKLFGAKTTPHVFVVDPEGVLAYQGAIDDDRSWDPAKAKGAKNYVAEALDAGLAGKPIETRETRSYGCSVKY